MSAAGEDVRDVEGSRFEVETDAGTARLDYRREGGRLHLTHTEVPASEREKGVGTRLVTHALDTARREGLDVVPSCPFVAAFIRDNPDYLDLVAEDWPGRERLAG